MSFTGLFHAENGHGLNADLVRKTPYGRVEYLGRSAADINEISTFFSSGNTSSLQFEFNQIFNLQFAIKKSFKFYWIQLDKFCFVGTDDDLVATATITILHRLEKGDELLVTLQKEKDHGESKLVSNSQSAGIHFSGLKISN